MKTLKGVFEARTVDFTGGVLLPRDPLLEERERVVMFAMEMWKVTGFRFK